MKKIIEELINYSIRGIDTYRFKDSTWLIFSDDVKWVVELTDEGTLWYNHKFFNNLFGYVSLDPIEGSKYISKWAEDYFFRPKEEITSNHSGAIHRDNLAMNIVHSRGVKMTKSDNDDRKRVFYNQSYRNGYVGVLDVLNEGVLEAKPGHTDESFIDNIIYDGNFIQNICYTIDDEYRGEDAVKHGIKNVWGDKNGVDYDWSDQFKADKVISDGKKIR